MEKTNTAINKNKKERSKSFVSIWWIVDGNVYSIEEETSDLNDEGGGNYVARADHYTEWSNAKKYFNSIGIVPKDDYERNPRGRISIVKGKLVLVTGKNIKPKDIVAVKKYYNLPKNHRRVIDDHYLLPEIKEIDGIEYEDWSDGDDD